MSITGHADRSVLKRYNVRRDAVQAEAAERRAAYLESQRGTPVRRPIARHGETGALGQVSICRRSSIPILVSPA